MFEDMLTIYENPSTQPALNPNHLVFPSWYPAST